MDIKILEKATAVLSGSKNPVTLWAILLVSLLAVLPAQASSPYLQGVNGAVINRMVHTAGGELIALLRVNAATSAGGMVDITVPGSTKTYAVTGDTFVLLKLSADQELEWLKEVNSTWPASGHNGQLLRSNDDTLVISYQYDSSKIAVISIANGSDFGAASASPATGYFVTGSLGGELSISADSGKYTVAVPVYNAATGGNTSFFQCQLPLSAANNWCEQKYRDNFSVTARNSSGQQVDLEYATRAVKMLKDTSGNSYTISTFDTWNYRNAGKYYTGINRWVYNGENHWEKNINGNVVYSDDSFTARTDNFRREFLRSLSMRDPIDQAARNNFHGEGAIYLDAGTYSWKISLSDDQVWFDLWVEGEKIRAHLFNPYLIYWHFARNHHG